ncbi:hypothetical protein AC578_2875 [Pseudocercospora eumusae]|uniref:Uncharacterized protein n=1 Tax=Pseudocercospora eumusae TaxID=321146 RepID=A0A139H3I1_9PEZI|nr:hypothetical protein AC578_2875 [Pseudocercospora eumusae]
MQTDTQHIPLPETDLQYWSTADLCEPDSTDDRHYDHVQRATNRSQEEKVPIVYKASNSFDLFPRKVEKLDPGINVGHVCVKDSMLSRWKRYVVDFASRPDAVGVECQPCIALHAFAKDGGKARKF